MNLNLDLIKKLSIITILIGLVTMTTSLVIFIINIYFSSEPSSIRAQNLIDALYMLVTGVLFLVISLYFNHKGR